MGGPAVGESGDEALPALLDLVVLPGEVVVPPLTWDEARAALGAADRGARRLVAVPGGRLRRGDIATLAEVVQVAHHDVRLVDAQLLGLRRVRIVQVRRGGPFPEVVVSPVPEPDQLPPLEAERLRAVIAACPEEEGQLDLDATPADLVDQLTPLLSPPLSLRLNFKRAILRTPTLEGRLRLLERQVMVGIDPLGHSSERGTDVDDEIDGPAEGLPEVVRQAIAREEQLACDFNESGRSRLIIRYLRELKWEDPPPPRVSPPEARHLLDEARRLLDEGHGGGHEEAKLKILDRVGDQLWERLHDLPPGTVQGMTGLLFVGPAGTGKTTLAGIAAAATHRHLERIPMGGIDAIGLAGSDRAYLGSGPGQITRRLATGACPGSRVALLFDELEKMARDPSRDPLPVLLALFDPSQAGFVDQFLPVPIPITGMMLMATANDEGAIPAPLLDRMEVIRLAAYTREEQVAIGRAHLLPRLLKGKEITDQVIQLDPEVIESLVFDFPPNEGMRVLEHRLDAVLKRGRRHHMETGKPIRVTVALARAWVGEPVAERRIGFHASSGIPSSRAATSSASQYQHQQHRASLCLSPAGARAIFPGRPSRPTRPATKEGDDRD
jgi:MoxR-like ATPase